MSTGLAFSRVLVDEWRRSGVTDAFVAPGSRSTPLAVALAERLDTHVILDERSAGFSALGTALASGRPTVVACTSGTAGANLYAAVIEASHSGVPLLVCTADRPPELHDIGAPQTTDQMHLYGRAVRWFAAPGPPDPSNASSWRSLASRAVGEATGLRAGPVHLNLAFREPFLDDGAIPGPPGRPDGGPWHRLGGPIPVGDPPADVTAICSHARRPVVVAGAGASDTLTLDGVPVLGDHRGSLTGTVGHWDLLLRRRGFAETHVPDLVVRVGMPPASKALAQWLEQLDVPQIVLMPGARWIDPSRNSTWLLSTPRRLTLTGESGWAASWQHAGERAGRAVDAVLAAHAEATEPDVAKTTLATLPTGSTLVVSSSMPIRDLESFARPRRDVRVIANRGVNGIDGVVSTALGVALTGVPTTLLIGDLALLHDQGALTGLTERDVTLRLVVVDNDGGGIFSFLPQASLLEPPRFEQLFGTPQHVDLAALLTAHGIECDVVDTSASLHQTLVAMHGRPGVRALVVRTDRHTNVAVHDELAGAVAVALGT